MIVSNKIQELRQELKTLKRDYKGAKKIVKQNYKENMRLLKVRYKEDKKVIIRNIRNETNKNGISCTKLANELALYVCKPFKGYVENIAYKRENPEGFEADEVIVDTEEVLRYYRKKIAKGKQLKDKDYEILIELLMAVNLVIMNKKGKLLRKAEELSKELYTITSVRTSAMADEMISQFESLFENFTTEGN
jgi:hypothetical protein